MAVTAALAVSAVGVSLPLLSGGTERDTLVATAASPSPRGPEPVAGRIVGRVFASGNHPLPRIALLPADLSQVLDRTGPDGSFSVPCRDELLLAAYAPSRPDAPTFERSPGVADVAWRRVRPACGTSVVVVLPPGGVVSGTAPADRIGSDVRLARVGGDGSSAASEGPVFAARVQPDGSWRVAGLDTGRYLVQQDGRLVDVKERRVTELGAPLVGSGKPGG